MVRCTPQLSVTVCPFCADVLRAFFLLSISSYGMHATKLVHLAQFVALGWVVYFIIPKVLSMRAQVRTALRYGF